MSEVMLVRPKGEGWEILKQGHRRGSLHVDENEAVDRARALLGYMGGGEVQILNRTGKIRAWYSVLPK